MQTFTAQYESRCGLCDERINVDDECTHVDEQVCHLECAEAEEGSSWLGSEDSP